MRDTAVDVKNIDQAIKSLDDFMIGALLIITNLQAAGTDSVSDLDSTFATLDASLTALDRHQDPEIRGAVRELHADVDPIAEAWTTARSFFQEGRIPEGLAVVLPVAQPHIDPAIETLKKLNVITLEDLRPGLPRSPTSCSPWSVRSRR